MEKRVSDGQWELDGAGERVGGSRIERGKEQRRRWMGVASGNVRNCFQLNPPKIRCN